MTGMSETVMSIAYKRFNERAGFEKIDGKVFIRPHVLRKIFASTLEKNKMPHLMTRWMMGHTLDSTTSAYFKADPESIKEEYIQVLSHLTTNQKIVMKPVTTEGYDQLLKDSKEKTAQIESMKKKMEEMELKNKERDEFLDDLMTKRNVIKKVLEEVDKND